MRSQSPPFFQLASDSVTHYRIGDTNNQLKSRTAGFLVEVLGQMNGWQEYPRT